jgi:hypothetical protein
MERPRGRAHQASPRAPTAQVRSTAASNWAFRAGCDDDRDERQGDRWERACEANMIDEARLRHPYERAIFAATVVVNLALLATAIYLTAYGSEWLEAHPRLAKYAEELRGAVVHCTTAPVTRGPTASVDRSTDRST